MNKKNTSKKISEVKTKKPEVKPEEQVQVEELTVKPVASNHVIINDNPNPKAHWYVVHTYSGHENKVATALKQKVESMDLVDYVLELLIPTQNRIKIAKGKKQTIAEKYLPGYMLVKMVLTDESWLVVRTTPGVTSFIGVGNRPTPISEEEVNAIKKFMEQEAPKYKATFTVGEAVKIVDGPFADFLGNVESIDQDKGKVKVLVSIFGRETPVELDFLQVAKI